MRAQPIVSPFSEIWSVSRSRSFLNQPSAGVGSGLQAVSHRPVIPSVPTPTRFPRLDKSETNGPSDAPLSGVIQISSLRADESHFPVAAWSRGTRNRRLFTKTVLLRF